MECTVIIPVGQGHEQLAEKALQSVMVAASEDPGPFSAVHVLIGDDTQNIIGRSRARNRMVRGKEHTNGDGRTRIVCEPWMAPFTGEKEPDKEADVMDSIDRVFLSEWLFFLDADDLMCSSATYGESAFKTVGKYVEDYDCIWGTIYELNRGDQIDKRKQVDRITTFSAYVKTPPTLSCQMGHFVRRDKFPGFDESLDVCEDIDLYLREWKNLKCIKQENPLFLNRRGFHTWMLGGKRTHTGRDWSIKANEMLQEARRELGNQKG